MEETIVKPRGGGGGGRGSVLITSPAREKKGTGSTIGGGGAGGGRRVAGPNGFVHSSSAARSKAVVDVTGETGAGQPPAPQTPQEPPKKRRNLDFVKPGGRAGSAAASAGRGAGGRVELFMPQYGSKG